MCTATFPNFGAAISVLFVVVGAEGERKRKSEAKIYSLSYELLSVCSPQNKHLVRIKIENTTLIRITSMMGEDVIKKNKEKVERLYKQREELEAEMASISQRLNGPNMPGLKGSLVDNEGFPIGGGDVDLYSVRADRQRYNSLKNDHLQLTNAIEKEVQQLLSSSASPSSVGGGGGGTDTIVKTKTEKNEKVKIPTESITPKTTSTNRKAFAVVDILAPGSPADLDGLMVHDRILDFGGAFSIADAALLIQDNLGKSHRVLVNRAGVDEILNIAPRTWNGNGLLGAHFRALNF